MQEVKQGQLYRLHRNRKHSSRMHIVMVIEQTGKHLSDYYNCITVFDDSGVCSVGYSQARYLHDSYCERIDV